MSTMNPSSSAAEAELSSVKIIGHSLLFFWWPVWAGGFLMAFLSYVGGDYMAVVPRGTVAEKARLVQGVDGPRDVFILPADRQLAVDEATGAPDQPVQRVARSNSLGAIFLTILLLVILITNVRITGVWTSLLLVVILVVSIVFALSDSWDTVFRFIGPSDVHITAAGYLCIAIPLFVIWLGIFYLYDRKIFATFGRGQFTIHHTFGVAATTFEVQGLSLQIKRDALFRHWLLGMGSGDLIIHTGGPRAQSFELSNVLFVSSKIAKAQRLIKERQVFKA